MDKTRIGLPSHSLMDKSRWTGVLENVFDKDSFEISVINPVEDKGKELVNFDFIIFDGGADVCPYYYGQYNINSQFHSVRDDEEYFIGRAYLHKPTKFVGFCRGLQFLNVLFNGTLYQDLYSIGKPHKGKHLVYVEDSSNFLKKFINEAKFQTNSLHHQAIDILGLNLRTTLYHENGIIEGIESITGDKVRAVQSHPEFLQLKVYPNSIKILNYLFRRNLNKTQSN